MSTKRKAVIVCIVCRRDNSSGHLKVTKDKIESFTIDICEQCRHDDFKMAEAMRRAGER